MLGGIGIACLQLGNDAVADVDLIVEILALQVVELEVEGRADARVHKIHCLDVKHGRVERADDVVADVGGIGRLYGQVDTLDEVVQQVAIGVDTAEHLVEDGRLPHPIDAAEDVDMGVELPQDMLLAAPEGVNLYLLDVGCVLHSFIEH